MESKHSKGTWLAKDGEIYVEETGKTIALMTYFDDDNEEQAANAELIATAPKLLIACEEAKEESQRQLYMAKRSEEKDILSYNIGRLSQAIYEATGE